MPEAAAALLLGWRELPSQRLIARRARSKWVSLTKLVCAVQVFCQKHPELSQHLLHARGAIFTSATSSSLGCCGIGQQAAAAEAAASTGGSVQVPPAVRQVSPSEAAATVFNTDKPRSITALIVDRAYGKTVKQRIKDKGFADINYVAEVLLQLVPVLAVMQQELGFNHDDLRLDNILESFKGPASSRVALAAPKPAGGRQAAAAFQLGAASPSPSSSWSTGQQCGRKQCSSSQNTQW